MTTRNQRRLAKKQASKYSQRLTEVPRSMWPTDGSQGNRFNAWLSRDYLVQAFDGPGGVIRLSINRTTPNADGWDDGLTWDELMEIKRQCGFGDRVAVEIYPDDTNIVNVANMRHLWLLTEAPPFMWRQV